MKDFSKVYNISKEIVNAEKQNRINSEHKMILEAIKHEYMVDKFGSLNESEQASYKALILEMWNPKEGLTKKGLEFLNESKTILTDKSTDDQIKKYFVNAIKAQINDIMNDLSRADIVVINPLLKDIKEFTGKKVSNKDAKQWTYEVVCKFVGDKIKSYKLQ